MADFYGSSNHHNNTGCTRNQCWIAAILGVMTLFIFGLVFIPTFIPIGILLRFSDRPLMLPQGQTRIVEGKDSTFCSGLSINITSKRTTVTLYRLSQFPKDTDIDIDNYITESAIESCSAGRGHGRICTVSNDPSSTYVVTTSSGPPHESSVRVPVKCQLAGGPIAGIVIGSFVVYTLFCAGLLVGVLCCARWIANKTNLK